MAERDGAPARVCECAGAAAEAHRAQKSHCGPYTIHTTPPTRAGFRGQERAAVAALAGRLGVRYAGELTCGASTHLVCRDLVGAVNTPKYLMALEWGVQVSPLLLPGLCTHRSLALTPPQGRHAATGHLQACMRPRACMGEGLRPGTGAICDGGPMRHADQGGCLGRLHAPWPEHDQAQAAVWEHTREANDGLVARSAATGEPACRWSQSNGACGPPSQWRASRTMRRNPPISARGTLCAW